MNHTNFNSKTENVWDYPRPPRLERVDNSSIKVIFNGKPIIETSDIFRVLETSHPPTYYLSPQDRIKEFFQESSQQSYCEWKGKASYYDINVGGKIAKNSAWYYKKPAKDFEVIRDYIAIYANQMDACYLNGEKVLAQEGSFYGGWITKGIVGPFKGCKGTQLW